LTSKPEFQPFKKDFCTNVSMIYDQDPDPDLQGSALI
jgi:hypothetical protein